jgi:penicillin amidase
MKISQKEIAFPAIHGAIKIQRDTNGIPHIKAENEIDMFFAQGYTHAHDRLSQMCVTRLLARGELSRYLINHRLLRDLDMYMLRIDLSGDALIEAEKLDQRSAKLMSAYASGVNQFMALGKRPWLMKLLGYRPASWSSADSIMVLKVMGFMGMTQSQAYGEKFIIQLIQKGLPEKKLKELFPFITEKIDYDTIARLNLLEPVIPAAMKWLLGQSALQASNNWALSGRKTRNKKALLANDPHVAMNHLPSIWLETCMQNADNFFLGASVPGIPGMVIGRTRHLSWGITYASMDTIDYYLEDCKNGKYRQGDAYHNFSVRNVNLQPRFGKKIPLQFYENPRGVLEGRPTKDGYFLTFAWSGRKGTGSAEIQALFRLLNTKNSRSAMKLFAGMSFAAFNWVMADGQGNIGLQTSGKIPHRKKGLFRKNPSGLVPLAGWEKANAQIQYYSSSYLPREYNPKRGFVFSANHDLNKFAKTRAITLPIGDYRAERIAQILDKGNDFTTEQMKAMQFDLYSCQAQKIMELISPRVPDSENGHLLRAWDLCYTPESKGAMLFENVYHNLLLEIFGQRLGKEAMQHLLGETAIGVGFYKNFDRIIQNPKSSWFENVSRDELIQRAISRGLDIKARPYTYGRSLYFHHAIFGDKFPKFIRRLNLGPYAHRGSRATLHQGQIFHLLGKKFVIGPSYRFITDFAEESIHSTLAGGPSDDVLSPWYAKDLDNWHRGEYKKLSAISNSEKKPKNS